MLGSYETTYLSALCMNLIDCLHGVQVVDTRVKTNFIHYNDASSFYSILQCPDCRGDIACRDDVCFAFYGGFNDMNMERVRNKRDNCIDG
jgi:hypothetical protein